MRDPHVERLYFRISAEEGTAYRNPPTLSFTNALGKFETQAATLVIEPAAHFASEDEARAVIEAYLRAWEIEADLAHNLGTIRFTFDRADLVDRDPPPPGHHSLMAGTARLVITMHPATLTVTRNEYPAPPKVLRTSPEVQIAYQRWREVRLNREPLLGMAYWLLTLVEFMAGNRKRAATTFNIEFAVLDTLGRLSSTRGDLASGRKVKPRQSGLSPAEQSWLEVAVKRLILQVGQHGSGSPVPKFSMSDLPPL